MLKISTVKGRHQSRLVVEGKLIAPWTGELRRACEETRGETCGRGFVIDLGNVTVISQEGENLLFELMQQGFIFRCHGVYAKHVLRQLARRAQRNSEEKL